MLNFIRFYLWDSEERAHDLRALFSILLVVGVMMRYVNFTDLLWTEQAMIGLLIFFRVAFVAMELFETWLDYKTMNDEDNLVRQRIQK